jgi:hypothetical protein
VDQFYVWTAVDEEGGGSTGVTGDLGRAREELAAALQRLAPGAVGTYHVVRLDRYARRPTYIHGRVLARLRRSADAIEPGV